MQLIMRLALRSTMRLSSSAKVHRLFLVLSVVFLQVPWGALSATAENSNANQTKQNSRAPAAILDPNSRLWNPPVFGEQKAMGYDAYTFETPPALQSQVDFWIKIYTHYTTRQGVFHIAGDTEHILGEIDLTDVFLNQKWSPIRREKEAERIVERKRKRIAAENKIKDVKTVRLQMGLKDRMEKAVFESGRYIPMMEEIFEKQNIPKELVRVVFVESSFNVEARSRVGASGLWQIMPILGKQFKYIENSYDKRDHPYFATILAAKILKQNYNILKSWPLAVTSYNFGVGSMLKIQKKLKSKDAKEIFASDNLKKHMGFASRNFYATFLAALHVESHANIYFGEPMVVAKNLEVENLHITKKIKIDELVEKHSMTLVEFKKMNPHIKNKLLRLGQVLPKGTLITVPANKVASESVPEQ